MTPEQARTILSCYRPWSANEDDASTVEALALVRQDAELRRWFEERCAVQEALRARFKGVVVPTGLREEILSHRELHARIIWWRQPRILAAAAAVALLISVAAGLLHLQRPAEDESFSGFRNRIVRQAVRTYSMDLETNDVRQIRAYLSQRQAHADFVAPANLAQKAAAGCGVLSWQGRRVTMVCFQSGRPLGPDVKSDLFLFVIDRVDLPGSPPERAPSFQEIGGHATASWSEQDKAYVLAGLCDEAFLRGFFEP